jgi:hypothetical protein
MAIAFFDGTGNWFLNILRGSESMDTRSFVGEMINGLQDVCDPDGRNPDQKITIYFDNAKTQHQNGHGPTGAARIQEDRASALWSVFSPV